MRGLWRFFVAPLCGVPLGLGGTACSKAVPSTPVVSLTADAARDAVERGRYETDLAFVARPRSLGSAHWQAVQDLCATRLTELGFDVERQNYGTGVNVVGTLRGQEAAHEEVVLSAHYDHIAGCAGADDNASGVAGLLESARVLAQGRFRRTLRVICFDEEERGLVGSRAYTKEAVTRQRIVVNLNYEMIGFRSTLPNSQAIPNGFDALFIQAYNDVRDAQFRGDFIAVVADEDARPAFEAVMRHAEQVGIRALLVSFDEDLKPLLSLSALARSDHSSFWVNGYPAVMLTDTAEYRNTHYHCQQGPDGPERLDLDFARGVVAATTAAAVEVLGPVP